MNVSREEVQVYTVRELSQWIKDLLETDIGRVWVEGEISGLKVHARSGHAYFSLRDEEADALLNCVAWASSVRRFRVEPRDGLRVRVQGYVSLWEPRGNCQFYVDRMVLAGEGELHRAFLELKAKLDEEGLFDPDRKRPLPRYPRRIGIATAPDGAALRDMLAILESRWPVAEVFVAPALVQGPTAAGSLVRALGLLQKVPELDFIILGRGGGSLEDLWAFNEEKLARAVARSTVPVVSAVGHEVDFTITDFVADVRAATPTHAAELSTPNHADVEQTLSRARQRLRRCLLDATGQKREQLRRLAGSRAFLRPETRVQREQLRLDRLADRLKDALAAPTEQARERLRRLSSHLTADRLLLRIQDSARARQRVEERWRRCLPERMGDHRRRLDVAAAALRILGPTSVLERGYGIIRNPDGTVLRSAADAPVGTQVEVRLAAGELECRVEARTLPEEKKGSAT